MCQCSLAFIAHCNVYLYPFAINRLAQIPLAKHGLIYLPLLLVSLFFAFPSIIIAEKYRKMRGIFYQQLQALLGVC
jgi:hypothetical protein